MHGDVVPGGVWPGRPTCGGTWSISIEYVYLGASTDPAYVKANAELNVTLNALLAVDDILIASSALDNYANQWDRAVNYTLEPIVPTPVMEPVPGSYAGGVPSVLLSREACTATGATSSAAGAVLKARMYDCAANISCATAEMFQALTGNVGAKQPNGTSITSAFRTALIHLVGALGGPLMDSLYGLGAHSYLSESAYDMTSKASGGWQRRQWGDQFDALLKVKRARDPTGVFWCRHCVGDDDV